jgi:hypothetical protein
MAKLQLFCKLWKRALARAGLQMGCNVGWLLWLFQLRPKGAMRGVCFNR